MLACIFDYFGTRYVQVSKNGLNKNSFNLVLNAINGFFLNHCPNHSITQQLYVENLFAQVW